MIKGVKVTAYFPLIILLCFVALPLEVLNFHQRIVLGSLIVVVYWWATGALNRSIASAFLLMSFLFFGKAGITEVFNFPLSSTFIIVFSSFLLAQAITNAQIADQIANSVLRRWGNSPYRLILMSYVLATLLIFIIPHPFPRVIILGTIFNSFLKKQQLHSFAKGVLLMTVYVAGTTTPMLFLNGDFILNYAAIGFAEVPANWGQWAYYMTLPGIIACLVIASIFILVFRKELSDVNWNFEVDVLEKNNSKNSQLKMRAYIVMLIIMALWATESWHGISSAWVGLLGVIAMFVAGLLKLSDWRKVNLPLLLYLTAVFSIGRVLKSSGITIILEQYLTQLFATSSSLLLYLIMIVIVMIVHMILGSCVTTMSITIPIFVALLGTYINPLVIAMIAYITVSVHYILPYHHLTLLLGTGEEYFNNAHVRRFGVPMTVVVFIIVFLIYMPWWRFVGLM